jgi:hypothetical protein
MGSAHGQTAEITEEESTNGILSLLERSAVTQIRSNKDDPASYQFTCSIEEIEKRNELNEMINKLENDNFVFVNYNGEILSW